MSNQTISKTGEKLVLTLARKVRVLSMEQIAKGWFDSDLKAAVKEVAALSSLGLLTSFEELIAPRLPATVPFFTWNGLGGKTPDFEKLAYASKKRWGSGEAVKETVVHATKAGVAAVVGFVNGEPSPPMALRHDLQVSEVFLSFYTANDRRWRRWQGEDQLKQDGYSSNKSTVPDAVIRDRKTRSKDIVIEIGGEYTADKFRELHGDFESLTYEIW
jgi:hypothetical protein